MFVRESFEICIANVLHVLSFYSRFSLFSVSFLFFSVVVFFWRRKHVIHTDQKNEREGEGRKENHVENCCQKKMN